MSYNGIGLSTVRGSGTNGFVQRNLSTVRRVKEKVGMKTEEELASLDLRNEKKPNLELLEHDRKRRVEVKCVELQDLMEEQGYDDDEIQKKVDSYRQMLLENQGCLQGKEDSSGRPIITETHQIAEMKEKENEALRSAFGIRKDYVRGSAFMNDGPANVDKAESKQYKLVRSPSKSPSPGKRKEKRRPDRRAPEKRSPDRRTPERKLPERRERHRRRNSSSVEESSSDERRKRASKKRRASVKESDHSDSDRDRHRSRKAKHRKDKQHSKQKKHKEKKTKHSKSHKKHKKSNKSRRSSDSDDSSESDYKR